MKQETKERLSSRKFLSLVGLFTMSSIFAWFHPDFVGGAQTLFNFWIFLIGLYFGANISEKYFTSKNGK